MGPFRPFSSDGSCGRRQLIFIFCEWLLESRHLEQRHTTGIRVGCLGAPKLCANFIMVGSRGTPARTSRVVRVQLPRGANGQIPGLKGGHHRGGRGEGVWCCLRYHWGGGYIICFWGKMSCPPSFCEGRQCPCSFVPKSTETKIAKLRYASLVDDDISLTSRAM